MDDLLIKYILEEASPKESNEVQQWLAADAANRTRFQKLQHAWQLAAQPSLQPATNTPQALQRLKQTLQTRQTAPVKRIWTRVGTAAAAVVGIAGVVLGAYVVLKPNKPPVKKIIPVVHPDTARQKRILVDTVPLAPADTIPVVRPHKKKQPAPARPVQPVRPKKKAMQPVAPVDTTVTKRKHAQPSQPVSPVRKHKVREGLF
jgi:hypothetical protein